MSKYQPFNLLSLYKMRGLEEEFDRCLAQLRRYCLDRRTIDKAREMTLKLKVSPDPGDEDNVIVEPTIPQLKLTRPPLDKYRMTTGSAGDLRFQPNFPLDPHQQELFGDDEGEAEE